MTHNYTIDSITSQWRSSYGCGFSGRTGRYSSNLEFGLHAFPNVVAVRSFLASLMLAAIPQNPASIQNTAVGNFTL